MAGDVPAGLREIADEGFAELGLPGLALAGGGPGTAAWVVTKGWADLDRGEELRPWHRWPAYCGSALVTTTAVLRLVADGRLTLDAPANGQLRTVQLEDATITVRDLLTHTAGVDSPAPSELLADHVPDLVSVTGPVVSCSGPRGTVRPSNGGFAVLGQLIADVTGVPYAQAATELVLEPLGLAGSSFPARPADLGPDAVTGYNANPDGTFTAGPGGDLHHSRRPAGCGRPPPTRSGWAPGGPRCCPRSSPGRRSLPRLRRRHRDCGWASAGWYPAAATSPCTPGRPRRAARSCGCASATARSR